MHEKMPLASKRNFVLEQKHLRNPHLDGWKIAKKLQLKASQSHLPASRSSEFSVRRPVFNDDMEKEYADEPLRSWLVHSTNADTKERLHFWKLCDGLITLYMTEGESLFFKKIPVESIKEVRLLNSGTKLKFKILKARAVMFVKSKDKARSASILNRWYVALNQTSNITNALKITADVADFPGRSSQEETCIFSNIQFALHLGNGTLAEKETLRQLIKKNGGQISYILTKNTNYLVNTGQSDSYRLEKATNLGIPIVSEDFVHQCVASKKLLPTLQSDKELNILQKKFAEGMISVCQEFRKEEDTNAFNLDSLKKYKMDDAECPDFPDEHQVGKFSFLVGPDMKLIACVEAHVAVDSQNPVEMPYRVMISIKNSDEKIRRHQYFVSSTYELFRCYESVVKSFENDVVKRCLDFMDLTLDDLPSEKLRNLLEEMHMSKGMLHHKVEQLVTAIWNDSLGALADYDIVPDRITVHDVRNGLITLLKIELALKAGSDIRNLSKDFYKHMHRKCTNAIDSFQMVAKEREICQILKDVVCVKENFWNAKDIPPSLLQYSALNCVIKYIDPSGAEFKLIKDLLPGQNEMKYRVLNVYQVSRSGEDLEFRSDIKNGKLLFHSSSAANFVSILSRGLLMPSKASDELGVPRTDEGMLGHGIYFSDTFGMSCKYTNVSSSRGSRLMLIHQVALGNVYKSDQAMPQLVSAPTGYDSVKGVNLVEDLKGNEFVVYNVNQQRMKYLIEFTLDGESARSVQKSAKALSIVKELGNVPIETPDYSGPTLKKVTFGLVSSEKNSVNLEEFHVRGKIVDLVAEVVIFQVYRNKRNSMIEGKYVFPLEENVAVCGFEAYINDKHVIGEVKEKEQAHKEYKKAVAAGHGAYLMDEEQPSVFTLSLGNIPAHARIVIKIKYVCDLETVNDPDSCILFTLPKNLSNWKQDSALIGGPATQSETQSLKVAQESTKTSFLMSVDMPYDILQIESPTHSISFKKTMAKACVKLTKSASLLDKNLRLLIKVAEIHVPRMWMERNDEISSEVSMVTFFPEFDFSACEDYCCTILLDMSFSMNGKPCTYAKHISKLLIEALPARSKFNVIIFGSYFKEVFVAFEQTSDNMKKKAFEIVNSCQPTLGGSDLIHVLRSMYLLLGQSERHNLHNVFLLSDGHLGDEERVLRLVSKISDATSSQTRFFSFAVDDSPNSHLLRRLSTISGGRYEHFLPATRHTWAGQVDSQMKAAKQPVLTDVYIDWCNYEAEKSNQSVFESVPDKPKCLFSGSKLTAFSFMPNCTKATLHARILGTEISTVVMLNLSNNVIGKTLHCLASKAVFKEYDAENLADDSVVSQIYQDQKKSFLVSLSIKHSVVCKFTSFIAVEKRHKGEDMTITTGPTIDELLKSSFEDELPEIQWQGVELSVQDQIDELLKLSKQSESSSVLQARELTQKAVTLCETLPDEPLKKLLVSASCFRLGMQYCGLSSDGVLKNILLRYRFPNYEILNKICRCEDQSYSNAVEELASSTWSSDNSVRLSSIPKLYRPIIISAFCCLWQRDCSVYEDPEGPNSFWNYILDVDMEQDFKSVSNAVRRNLTNFLRKLRPRRRRIDTYCSIDSDTYCSIDTYCRIGGVTDKQTRRHVPRVRALKLCAPKSRCVPINTGQNSQPQSSEDSVEMSTDTLSEWLNSGSLRQRPVSTLIALPKPPLPPRDYSHDDRDPFSAKVEESKPNLIEYGYISKSVERFSSGRSGDPTPSWLTTPLRASHRISRPSLSVSQRRDPPPSDPPPPPVVQGGASPPVVGGCGPPPVIRGYGPTPASNRVHPPPVFRGMGPPPSHRVSPPPPPVIQGGVPTPASHRVHPPPPPVFRGMGPPASHRVSPSPPPVIRSYGSTPVSHRVYPPLPPPGVFCGMGPPASHRVSPPPPPVIQGGVSTPASHSVNPPASHRVSPPPPPVIQGGVPPPASHSVHPPPPPVGQRGGPFQSRLSAIPPERHYVCSAPLRLVRSNKVSRNIPAQQVSASPQPGSADVRQDTATMIAKAGTKHVDIPEHSRSLMGIKNIYEQQLSVSPQPRSADVRQDKSTLKSEAVAELDDIIGSLERLEREPCYSLPESGRRTASVQHDLRSAMTAAMTTSDDESWSDDSDESVLSSKFSSREALGYTEKKKSQPRRDIMAAAELDCPDGEYYDDFCLMSNDLYEECEELNVCYDATDVSARLDSHLLGSIYDITTVGGVYQSSSVALLAVHLLNNNCNLSKYFEEPECHRFTSFPDLCDVRESDYCSMEFLVLKTMKEAVVESGGKSLGPQCFKEALRLLYMSVLLVLFEHVMERANNFSKELEEMVKISDQKYPLLYHRLELGSSWPAAARSVIDMVCGKFSK